MLPVISAAVLSGAFGVAAHALTSTGLDYFDRIVDALRGRGA